MNRQIVQPGAIPLDTDLLTLQRNTMIALGYLGQAVMGQGAWCAGLACTPTAPASLVVNVAPGIIGQQTVVDETPFGSLPADTADGLVKMGVNLASTAMAALTPPSTSGQSQCWLLQAQMLEADGNPVVLPYYNAANPSQPYSGPGNSGAAQNTVRAQTVALQWVAGAPATTGTQAVPAASAGWVPLYVVTLANGATAINAGNIVVHPQAPFINFSLPQLTPGFRNKVRLIASGSWSLPPGYTAFRVTVIGGGGGGGSCQATSFTQDASGSGGGAGARAIKTYTGQTPGTQFSYVVGPGGASQVAGGNSSFNGTVIAGGGQPGLYQALASAAGGQGGTATGGDINDGGGSGSDGQSQTFVFAGNGAPGPYGGGGRAGNHAGFSGSAPGAGGGGAYDVSLTGTFFEGGSGANGCIEIEY